MKTFLKRFGFLAVLAIMFNVEVVGQEPFEPGIYAFVNDTALSEGCDTILLGHNGTAAYPGLRDSRISAIEGDSLIMAYFDLESNAFINVIWKIENEDFGSSVEFVYVFNSHTSLGYLVSAIDAEDEVSPKSYIMINTKFSIAGQLEIPEGKSMELSFTEFTIEKDLALGGFDAEPDVIYWFKDGIEIPETNSETYTPMESGNYSVAVKYNYITREYIFPTNPPSYPYVPIDSVFNTTSRIYYSINSIPVTINPTEIDLLSSNEKLTVYPNPATDILSISEEVEYSVYSYSGQELLRGFGKEIDVAKLSVGTYILKTDKGDNKFTVVQ